MSLATPMTHDQRLAVYQTQNGGREELTPRQRRRAQKKLRKQEGATR